MNLQPKFLLSIFLILSSAALFSNLALSADLQTQLESEVKQYINQLQQTEGRALVELSNQITSSGLSDKRLFDEVQSKILTKHNHIMSQSKNEDVLIHQVVALLRTLASSGDYQYHATLNKVMRESSNRSIRNRAKHVMSKFGFYQNRNQIMQDLNEHTEEHSLHTTRLLNLFNSDDLIMNRFAAEEVFRAGTAEPIIQEWIAARLKRDLHIAESKLHIDTLAWYCKVLGLVNKNQYAEFLRKIVKDKSVDSKIRKHTKKILKS